MSRLFVVIAALSSASVLSMPAFAQLNEGPPMPSGMDLAKVPVGSWAEYAVGIGDMPNMKTRMALVGRSKGEATVEMVVEGGMMAAAGGKMIMQTVMVVDGAQGGAGEVKKLVIQVGPNDPMEMPAALAQRKQFQKPDPKALIKEETVKVAAGTFKAKHYRDTTPKGDVLDYWLSDKVPPLGLVKVVGEQKGGVAGQKGPVTFELSSFGKDAKTAVLKPVKPFDQQAFMGQVMGAAGAPAGAKGPAGPLPPAAPTK
jgi:hypothetical protein